jgi:hypothetical protein
MDFNFGFLGLTGFTKLNSKDLEVSEDDQVIEVVVDEGAFSYGAINKDFAMDFQEVFDLFFYFYLSARHLLLLLLTHQLVIMHNWHILVEDGIEINA